ncbi:glutamine/asparagine-rich protein pqn-25, putative [Entamoeba invadens IP1]|uniref:Glutamine/asparagine-rich protein pqn-25, putative n=1 Tax=Entamoeba invadens IP1 TaxID=370355 RepID=L7FND8_ENTIV|nr:glutamine/asparagine-rich protein pqn-25, putative [Entamoeba invadens IP1]ELP87659.1 glutamine/asparagine-rich protein pqn-25, putative [Entamoeba invadens IP1]|eukprot:XP_004254430.1 glutamine/asparagine-rich protein pqn-25, putative [Entamoeba invadens IP1]
MFEYFYNFTNGKGYLISNKKLIRFCPQGTPLDKDVVCTLKKPMYTPNSPTNMENAFDYPHFTTSVIEEFDMVDASFLYSTSLNTITCNCDSIYNFTLYQNVTKLQIDCIGNIKSLVLYENTNIVISKNTTLSRIYSIDFSENNKTFILLEKVSDNNVISNCFLVKVTNNKITGVVCHSDFLNDNGECFSLVINCGTYNKNNKCVLCKSGYVLNDNSKCISSETCLYGTITNCYKCQNGYIRNNNECVFDTKCQYSDGSVCIKYHAGNSYNKCESCASNCTLCGYNLCFICNNNFILNNETLCVKKIDVVSNKVLIIGCNDMFYIDNGVCNTCLSKFENSLNCDKHNTISCEVNYTITYEKKCEYFICQNETFTEQNGMFILEKDKCVYIVNNKCVECENKYILNINRTCVNITNDTSTTVCVTYYKYACISCAVGYYLSNARCYLCSENCTSCHESGTKCLSCKSGFYQSDIYQCQPSTELLNKCDNVSTITTGCYQCKDQYYRVGMDCLKCLLNCSTCNTKNKCLACNLTNYKTNSGDCLP